jgi:hypothetical protein
MTIPLPVIANTWRVAVGWHETITGQHAVNVMHFKDTLGGGTATGLQTTLNGHWTAAMVASQANLALADTLSIIALDGTASTVILPGPSVVGGTAGDWIPQVSELVSLKTGVRGRANRGRIYLPFVAEGAVGNGVLMPATVAPLNTAWEAFRVAMQTAHWSLVVASYDRAHSGAGAHENIVTTCLVETQTATQRRRQPGRKVARH